MKVLVACEYSGRVRDAFRSLGHDATSVDFLPTEVDGPHIQGDVLEVLRNGGGWDMMIAHPPCTYLAASGLHWNKRVEGRAEKTEEALAFVRTLLGAPIPRIALENPVSCISTRIRKPDQIIQPWQFGHDASKSTCLWLKGLHPLRPTKIVEPEFACCGTRFSHTLGKYGCPKCGAARGPARQVFGNQTASGQNRLSESPDRWKERSRTFEGIAAAMASQWGTVSCERR
jgi:hypothetical protein